MGVYSPLRLKAGGNHLWGWHPASDTPSTAVIAKPLTFRRIYNQYLHKDDGRFKLEYPWVNEMLAMCESSVLERLKYIAAS